MSDSGHSHRFDDVRVESALPLIATAQRTLWLFSVVPMPHRSGRCLGCDGSMPQPYGRCLACDGSMPQPYGRRLACDRSMPQPHGRCLLCDGSMPQPYGRCLACDGSMPQLCGRYRLFQWLLCACDRLQRRRDEQEHSRQTTYNSRHNISSTFGALSADRSLMRQLPKDKN